MIWAQMGFDAATAALIFACGWFARGEREETKR